jgi:hypothetical protein
VLMKNAAHFLDGGSTADSSGTGASRLGVFGARIDWTSSAPISTLAA